MEKSYFDDYTEKLIPRIISPTLNDLIARGVRGLPDKFAENERVMIALGLLLRNGIEPKIFIDLVAAAIVVAGRGSGGRDEEHFLDMMPEELGVRRRVRERCDVIRRTGGLDF